MTNPMKIKGAAFERLAVDVLNELVKDSEWKKVPGSGALGTSLFEPLLTADIVGRVKSIPKSFKVECKVGYNTNKASGVKQFTLKKEWMDKVKKEADSTHAIPILMGKFEGVREGTKIFVAMDVAEFAAIINHITKLQEELDELGIPKK